MSYVIRKTADCAPLKVAACCLSLLVFPVAEAARREITSYLRIPQSVLQKRQAMFEAFIDSLKADRKDMGKASPAASGPPAGPAKGEDGSASQEAPSFDKPSKDPPEAPSDGDQAAALPVDSPKRDEEADFAAGNSPEAAEAKEREVWAASFKEIFAEAAAEEAKQVNSAAGGAKPFLLEEEGALLLKGLRWAHVQDDSGRFSHIDIRSSQAFGRAAEFSKTYTLPDRIVQRLAEISRLHNEGPEYGLGMTESHKITAALTSAGVRLKLYGKKETEALLQYIRSQGWDYFVRRRIQAIESLGEIAQNQALPRETANYMSKLTVKTKHPDVRAAAFAAFSKTAANHPPDVKTLRRQAAGMKLLREERAAPEGIDDKPFQQLAQAVPLPPELINELAAQRSSGALFSDDFFKRLTALAEKNKWPAESLAALKALTEEGGGENCSELFQPAQTAPAGEEKK